MSNINTNLLNRTFTITFGDQAENHKGMQIIGNLANVGDGFNNDDMKQIMINWSDIGAECELLNLAELSGLSGLPDASVLIIRNGLEMLEIPPDDMFEEQLSLDYDKLAYMYGRVVNKKARWNICFGNDNQDPDYENKKGRIVEWNEVPLLKVFMELMPDLFGEKANKLYGEGNYYYDINKCGIGYHGDSERRKVIAVRLGASMPLYYQWYKDNKPVGNRIKVPLNHGDIYVMSEKAVGTDWKRKSIYTLRHAAGCNNFVVPSNSKSE
jgi:alkylated DNA repair dioxygenase AlkB